MNKLLTFAGAFLLTACAPQVVQTDLPPVSSSVPVVGAACSAISDTTTFDTALKGYDVARAAVNSLIDFGVIKPGTPLALKIATANDTVLHGFAVAEAARRACNATGYLAALNEARAGIAEIQAILPHK